MIMKAMHRYHRMRQWLTWTSTCRLVGTQRGRESRRTAAMAAPTSSAGAFNQCVSTGSVKQNFYAGMMPGATTTALASWRFTGTLRHYQADVLERVDTDAGSPLHIVAPPGSGKTLLGLLLAARRGRRAVVLTPTTTIRAQWARAAESLAPDAGAVSEDPGSPADLTVLTYQALSVLDAANPFAVLAHARWRDELEGDGRSREAAEQWLAELEAQNRPAYRRGIASRSRTLRRRLVRADSDALASVLHPNALALIDRLVAHEVDTIVLDECHHLLDHWAVVVATLVARLRAAGGSPLLIGLTATLPSPDDADEYDNYTSLLGDVDYEVPVPAVVREGNLAPYRDLVRFAEPTAEELAFLAAHAEGLAVLLRTTFARDTGLQFLLDVLQPEPDPEPPRSALEPPPLPEDPVDARLAAAFAADFAGAEAASAMLGTVAPQHPLVARIPDVARRPPSTDESLRLLARFALDRVLPDPAAQAQWHRIRRLLADFGYALTDRGVRRTRDPVDTMLASSLGKDYGACDILRLEQAALGERLRALVVTDFAEHGNTHGGLVGTAGALRTFATLVADAGTSRLTPILVTGGRTRIATRDADRLVPALQELVGVPVAAAALLESPDASELHAPGVGAALLVRAASVLLTRGAVQVVVGTRGLFGEGWDCPAVNTLIDLTAVSSASATQQLRGRTLRLDPAWPDKVAHNWTVTALLPSSFPLQAQPDATRLRRKHARLWGLDVDDPARVVRGLSIALSAGQRAAVDAVLAKDENASVQALNAASPLPERRATRAQWRIGAEYADREVVSALVPRRPHTPVFRTSAPASRAVGAALGGVLAASAVAGAGAASAGALVSPELGIVAGITVVVAGIGNAVPLAATWRQTRAQAAAGSEPYRRIAALVWAALRRAGRVADTEPAIVVVEADPQAGLIPLTIEAPSAARADQQVFADAMAELLGPVRTPRFLLETGRGGRSAAVRFALRRAARREPAGHFLAVPSLVGRRREDAEAFAAAWEREVGPCVLHAVDRPGQLALLARARRGGPETPAPATREEWR
ncbi:DEAD/DEAH box helicase [Microbacterium wangchenii]|uniref:DEAD/DEAH box helicase n=2 Tax=Microbacteriaceae TaxID=85023 RepID=A0ABX5SRW5_9MICO|nr:DEAD/DEAH box helicase [Microbacterium wangchenii]TXK20273.1 DEAD/DEAH box helicase [Microbacterium wangchenii]